MTVILLLCVSLTYVNAVQISFVVFHLSLQFSRLLTAPASARFQSTLVLADHHEGKLNEATLHAFSAAKAVGGEDLACLVAGDGVADVAKSVAAIDGLKKVIVVDSPDLKGESVN